MRRAMLSAITLREVHRKVGGAKYRLLQRRVGRKSQFHVAMAPAIKEHQGVQQSEEQQAADGCVVQGASEVPRSFAKQDGGPHLRTN